MSKQAPASQQGSPLSKRTRREQARTAGFVLLAILITLFAVLNTKSVEVNWIFGSGKAPLIVVIVVSLLVGIVMTYLLERRSRRR
jgi:lipopolysaccharide assembly protein A